jgi:adenylate cyclase
MAPFPKRYPRQASRPGSESACYPVPETGDDAKETSGLDFVCRRLSPSASPGAPQHPALMLDSTDEGAAVFQFTPQEWRTVLRTGLTVAIVSAGVSTVVWAGDQPRYVAPVYGFTVGLIAFGFVVTVREWVWNSRLVELRFGVFSLINLTLNAVALGSAILLTSTLFGIPGATRPYVIGALIAVGFTVWMTIDRFFGRGTLVALLTGRYHHPRYENRVFLFADLADSTPLALSLGDLRYHSLLNQVCREAGRRAERYGGSIHRYLGDEMIITWPWDAGTNDAACLCCGIAILESLQDSEEKFVEEYGTAPRLRIALHGGEVVAGEIAGVKREIVFSGDAINTTARIQSVASQLDRSLVISRQLLVATGLPDHLQSEELGSYQLKGRAELTELLAITAQST